MIIAKADILPCVMRKDDPTWAFARAASPVTEGWIFRLAGDDGAEGLGYASASAHLGSTLDGLKSAFEGFAPSLIGRDPMDLDALLDAVEREASAPSPFKAGIDCALHDLAAKAQGVPLFELFGRTVRTSVPILRTMAIKTPDEMARIAAELVGDGYRYLKIKVKGDVERDCACVEAIRERVGPEVHLTIDANQSYSPDDAIAALTRMADFGVELAEQPVAVDDPAGLKRVTDSVEAMVEADEGAGSLSEVAHLVSNRIVDAVSLKIPQLGGLRNTLAAARICEEGGIRYRMGGAVGPRLLTAQAMHLCATFPSMGYACEFGEFVRLLDDPTEGIEAREGAMDLPGGIASGVRLRP